MKLCIDSDQSGNPIKWYLISQLGSDNITDLRAQDHDQYPDIAHRLAKRVASKEFDRGILICRTGLGMAMVANKVKGVFAGTPQNEQNARHMARSNHAQVLTIGADATLPAKALEMVKAWLETPFEPRVNADRMRYLEAHH